MRFLMLYKPDALEGVLPSPEEIASEPTTDEEVIPSRPVLVEQQDWRAGGERRLNGYHLLPSVRGELLAQLGRLDEAEAEFQSAASLTRNGRERELPLARAAATTVTDDPGRR